MHRGLRINAAQGEKEHKSGEKIGARIMEKFLTTWKEIKWEIYRWEEKPEEDGQFWPIFTMLTRHFRENGINIRINRKIIFFPWKLTCLFVENLKNIWRNVKTVENFERLRTIGHFIYFSWILTCARKKNTTVATWVWVTRCEIDF